MRTPIQLRKGHDVCRRRREIIAAHLSVCAHWINRRNSADAARKGGNSHNAIVKLAFTSLCIIILSSSSPYHCSTKCSFLEIQMEQRYQASTARSVFGSSLFRSYLYLASSQPYRHELNVQRSKTCKGRRCLFHDVLFKYHTVNNLNQIIQGQITQWRFLAKAKKYPEVLTSAPQHNYVASQSIEVSVKKILSKNSHYTRSQEQGISEIYYEFGPLIRFRTIKQVSMPLDDRPQLQIQALTLKCLQKKYIATQFASVLACSQVNGY